MKADPTLAALLREVPGLHAIDKMLAVTHRDDLPCACDDCMEYGAEDAGADWHRIPVANRIVMRILDSGDDRMASLVKAFRDHEAAQPDDEAAAAGVRVGTPDALREALDWCLNYIEGTDVRRLTMPPLAEPFFSERIAEYRALAAPRAEPETTPCPAGCGCRLRTDDADRNDCACAGPCWDEFAEDRTPEPEAEG